MPRLLMGRRRSAMGAPPAANASGIALPSNNVTGWTLTYANDFATSFALGGVNSAGVFPAPYATDLWCYADGTHDTAGGTDFGANSIYKPSGVLSCTGSKIVKALHVVSGVPWSAVVGVSPGGVSGQAYGRFSACWRVPATFDGWKTAWLLWPTSETWPRDGEIDFPEGGINSNVEAYMHRQGGTSGADQDAYITTTPYVSTGLGGGWHVTTTEWAAGFCRFILDGIVVGTSYVSVPNTPMRWTLQTETDFSSYPANMPISTDAGTVEIDWIAVWALNGFTVPFATPPSATQVMSELFTGTNGSVWPTANWSTTTTTTGATAQIQSNRGRLTTGTLGSYNDLVRRNVNVSATANFILKTTVIFTAGTVEHYPWVFFRDVGGGNNYVLQFEPAFGWLRLLRNDGGVDTILSSTAWTYSTNLSLDVEIIAVGPEIQCRVWTTGGARPSTPQVGAYETTYLGSVVGLALLGGSTASSRTVDFDTVTVSTIP